MTGPTSPSPDDALRVGHVEREQVVALLGESMAGGYLSLDEFDHRISLAHEAATRGELRALLVDLPAATALQLPGSALPGGAAGGSSYPPAPTAPAGTAAAWRDEQVELRGTMDTTVSRRGAWRVPPSILLTGSMSTFKLDFAQADLPPGGVDLDVQATWSTVRLWLSPTMRLVSDRFDTSMWITLKDKAGPPSGPGGLVVNVHGKPSWTTVVVRRAKA